MKKIGDQLTLRGTIPINTNGYDIRVFDGSFGTGYKIEAFEISPSTPTNSAEIIAKVHTTPTTGSISTWDWGLVTELAWASWGTPIGSRFGYADFSDDDAVTVEDLYVSTYSTSETGHINYMIKIQKYKFPESTGALAMIQARSQA